MGETEEARGEARWCACVLFQEKGKLCFGKDLELKEWMAYCDAAVY